MRRWLLLPLMACICLQAVAEGSARDWLDQMKRAFKDENYQGVLIYGNDRHWETLSVTHGVIDGREHEKLHHLTGIPREVIRDGDKTYFIHPGDNGVSLNSGLPSPLQGIDSSADLSESYDFSLADVHRIAGRYARLLLISPKDNNRYGYRLWLDQDSGLLLRSEMLSERGHVLERFQFADVKIGLPLTEADFLPDTKGPLLTEVAPDQPTDKKTESPAWLPEWVPAGFILVSAGEVLPDVDETKEIETEPLRLLYTDGLAAFTLFVDIAGTERMPEMVSQWGATSAAVRYHSYNENRYRITAVGELPSAAISRIAASVTRQQKTESQH